MDKKSPSKSIAALLAIISEISDLKITKNKTLTMIGKLFIDSTKPQRHKKF